MFTLFTCCCPLESGHLCCSALDLQLFMYMLLPFLHECSFFYLQTRKNKSTTTESASTWRNCHRQSRNSSSLACVTQKTEVQRLTEGRFWGTTFAFPIQYLLHSLWTIWMQKVTQEYCKVMQKIITRERTIYCEGMWKKPSQKFSPCPLGGSVHISLASGFC